MSIELVIFDCDGVLVDSELLSAQSDIALFAGFGIVLEPQEYLHRYVGKSAKDTVLGVQTQSGVNLPDDILERKQAQTLALFERQLQAIPGIEDALERLPWPCCVASSSTLERIRFSLGLTGLLKHFEPRVFSASMVERGKPAPDLFLLAAQRMGAQPAACVVIEDSTAGVQAGVAAGMRVLGFTGGGHCGVGHAKALLGLGATRVFGEMNQLGQILEEIA